MIPVTKTYLPTFQVYTKYLEGIWERVWLTNRGPLALELEKRLCDYLGIPHLLVVSNGTAALQIAIKALGLQGEIITTPFSYVATTSSIVWEGCKPVFVDIDPETLCINPGQIEEAITEKTSAILATHVYGIPCDVEAIEQIARKHGLKVIYDAAHAFGVKYKGNPLLNWGDVSALSFHATKLFHTVEGGGIVTQDKDLNDKLFYMHTLGHNGPEEFLGVGINAKATEFHAAMGICVLEKINEIIDARRVISEHYDEWLSGCNLRSPTIPEGTLYNYAYYPVIFPDENSLLSCVKILKENDIYPRRYFYPALSKLPYVSGGVCPVAEDISTRVLCLPIYYDLQSEDQKKIVGLINQSFKG